MLRHQSSSGLAPEQVALSGALLFFTGLACGLVAQRYAAAFASCVGALAGWGVAYWANYTLFPGSPTPDSNLAGSVLLVAVFLLPIIGGGHLLGTWLSTLHPRRAY